MSLWLGFGWGLRQIVPELDEAHDNSVDCAHQHVANQAIPSRHTPILTHRNTHKHPHTPIAKSCNEIKVSELKVPEIVLTSLSNVNRQRFFFDVDFDERMGEGAWVGGAKSKWQYAEWEELLCPFGQMR